MMIPNIYVKNDVANYQPEGFDHEIWGCPENVPVNPANDMSSTGHFDIGVIRLIVCYRCIMYFRQELATRFYI